MPAWAYYSGLVIAFWGVVGLFQKLGATRISSKSLLIWLTVGYLILAPALLARANLGALSVRDFTIGILGGLTNGLGAWCLFASLEAGAKASTAVPLTALSPLVTIVLAILLLAERLTALQWTGVIGAIVAGVMISYEGSEVR